MRSILLILLYTLCTFGANGQQQNYALTNVNLFNGYEDKIYQNVVVYVKGKHIEKIGKAGETIPPTYARVDCGGNYLMPGLFDVHTHLDNLTTAQRALESGVTTVRSASVSAFQDVTLRELAKAGKIPGPDVLACGVYVTPNLDQTVLADPRLVDLFGGVNTDEELRKLVNINIDRGVDVIKTRGTERAGRPDTDPREQTYTQQQLKVVVDEAAKRNIPVMVHAHGDEGARAAVLAGARSIEHGTYLKDETLKLMKERGTYFVPTYITMEELNEEENYVLRLRGKFMVPNLEMVFKKAHAMGLKIATGADNDYTEGTINRISLEIEHFVRMGMSHFDAIQCATVNSAELLGVEKETGRIQSGYEADMVLIPANPLIDIRAVQDVLMVMSNGQFALNRLPFAKN